MSTAILAPTRIAIDPLTGAAVAVTVLGWASAFPAIRAGLDAFGPIELGALRFAVAAVPAAAYLILSRAPLPGAADLGRLALGGALVVALYTILLNTGELTVPAAAAGFIVNTAPIFTALFAGLVLGERFGGRGWVGTVLSFSGIGLIAAGAGGFGEAGFGALMILGAALCLTASALVQKPLFARHAPLTVSAWTILFGALLLAPGLPSALPQAAAAAPADLAAVLYLGLVPSFVAYGAWAVVLSRLPAGRAANFLYLVAPIATLIGFVWLGEVPTPLGVLGGILALAGVVVVNGRG